MAESNKAEMVIRPCGPADQTCMLAIINGAAEAYRAAIPDDCWHEPYMPGGDLASEIADGVVFSGCTRQGRLVGIMGVQRRCNVVLIRHAYVLPAWQGRGVGSALLEHLRLRAERPILIGTWQAATWAIRFYEKHGFALVDDDRTASVLRSYWTVPERQIATSVVLAWPRLTGEAASRLMAAAARPLSPDRDL